MGSKKEEKGKTTMNKEQQTKDLEEKIEWHLHNISHLPETSRTYQTGQKIIKMYAKQYKELTGDYYRRNF